MAWRTRAVLLLSLLALALLIVLGAIAIIRERRSLNATGVNASIQVASPLGRIPATAIGLNTSVYDANLLNAGIPSLLRAAGVALLRYPGGTEADLYHWQTNTVTSGQSGVPDARNSFDNFMTLVARASAQALITVNYGSDAAGTGGGDPQEAAAWVRYANVTKRYGIQYWEIGNEVYGNGTYGADWEPDLHPDKGPAAYGRHAMVFVDAMKAVDPTIKVGVTLTAPGNWPDGDLGQTPDWNSAVLSATCSRIDFVDIHWYPQDPGKESDATLLQSPAFGIARRTPSIPQMAARLRAEIGQYCPSRAGQIQIMVTETNSVSSNPGKQTVGLVNALFLADNYMTWLEQGVATVDWWQLHNNPVTDTTSNPFLYGAASYGDYGILAIGQAPEPAADTPFPAYYGLQMLQKLGTAGDEMVTAGADNPLIAVHAVKRADGSLGVLLLNKDSNTSHQVTLGLSGYSAAPGASIFSYGRGSAAISAVVDAGLGTSLTLTLAPYSLTTVVFTPAPHQP